MNVRGLVNLYRIMLELFKRMVEFEKFKLLKNLMRLCFIFVITWTLKARVSAKFLSSSLIMLYLLFLHHNHISLLNIYFSMTCQQCNDLALSDARSEAQSAERRLQDSERRCMVQARHLVKLQDDCEKLMKVTAELITALEAAVKGDMIDLDKVLSTCCQNFPDLFKFQHKNGTSSDRDPTIGSGSYSDSASRAQLMKDFLQQHSMELTDFTHVCLDFSKIKTDLVVQDTRSKTLLLQALRWRLTKTQPGEERDAVLSSYINNDLLGCEQPSQYRQRVLHMMRSPNRNLHQALLRFLNAFASFSLARTYLCKCPQLLAILQDNLINNRVKDSISQDMTLGIMQKLSLRHSLQTTMIAGGVVEWLVNTLGKATETLSDYGLEYGVALLMNLCLRTSGKKRCIDMAQRILQLLVDLLKLQNSEILPYVNGTLYSLLSVPEIKNKAQEMKLENTLQQLMNESSNDAQRQIEYVLKKFSIDDNKEGSASDGESDDDEDEAEIEPEIDKDDSVVGEIGELVGEKLLTSQYLGLPAAGISTQRKRDLSNAEVVPQRPSTPRTPKGGGNVGKEIRHTPEQTPSKGSHPRGGSRTLRFQGVEGVKNEKEHQSPKSRQDIHMLPTPPSVPEPGTNEYEIPKQPEQKLVKSPSRPPSSQSVPFSNNYGLNSHEYSLAFSSRPKIPRTPEPSASRPDTTPSPQPPQSCGMAQAPMSPKVAASSPPYSPHNAQNRHSGPHSRGRTTPHK
ncbi:lisH domain-containing protein ARMC9-like isoform X2 [Tachypleus tridentatus]|uniref:lisH domain-containing protein ARMC9-like isoform X2 n=2 Tax=Tachypleus tridentatus TaxID=6853 RepID=UPI003FD2DC73